MLPCVVVVVSDGSPMLLVREEILRDRKCQIGVSVRW